MKPIEKMTIKEAKKEMEETKLRYNELSTFFNSEIIQEHQQIPKSKEIDHGVCFCILSQGFMYIGHLFTDDKFMRVTEPINIRSYMSGKGLLWHVENGDAEMTLDRGGREVKMPFSKLEHFISTEKSLWY